MAYLEPLFEPTTDSSIKMPRNVHGTAADVASKEVNMAKGFL